MRRPFGWIMTGIVLSLSSMACARAAAPAAHPKVVLVELFTSEGCSSCPPADALLRKINGMETSAGQLIVGISEHVTYWNSLGWADPFSSSTYTDRQNEYGTHFGLDGVYTPQMVVNGREQFVGSNESELKRALLKEQERVPPLDLRILSATVEKDVLTVKFQATGDASLRGASVLAVVADDVDQSSVLRGENSGHTLAHVAVARSLAQVGKLQPGQEQTVQLPAPAALRNRQGHHLILFVQKSRSGEVLGADTAAL